MVKFLAVIIAVLVPFTFGLIMVPVLNHIERLRKENRGE